MTGITEIAIEMQVKDGDINVTGATKKDNADKKDSLGKMDMSDYASIQLSASAVVKAMIDKKMPLSPPTSSATGGPSTVTTASNSLFDVNLSDKKKTENMANPAKLTKVNPLNETNINMVVGNDCYVQQNKKIIMGKISGFKQKDESSNTNNVMNYIRVTTNDDSILVTTKTSSWINGVQDVTISIPIKNKIEVYVSTEELNKKNIKFSGGGKSKSHRKTLSKKQPKYKKQKSMRKL